MGEVMSNDVQSHEDAAERAAGEDRRANARHAARSLGSVTARIIGGSQVDLVNFSNRGVLFECDSRLLIGARASVRITTTDANLIVTGRVVRSRVKGLVNGALRYDAALALDSELALQPAVTAPEMTDEAPAPVEEPEDAPVEVAFESDDVAFESEPGIDGMFDPAPVEAYLAESDAALAEVAPAVEPPPVPMPAEPETASDALSVEPFHVNVTVGLERLEPSEPAAPSETLEPPPLAEPAALLLDAPAPAPEADAPVAEEVVAFEADGGEVAFEAASDFEFGDVPADEAVFAGEVAAVAEAAEAAEPLADASEPAIVDAPLYETAVASEGSSMFDATYRVPAEEAAVAKASQFEITPPMPVFAAASSSAFDSRPSEHYGDRPAADAAVEAIDTAEAEPEAIDFATEVAFEAEDAVMFEPAFEAEPAAPAAEETPEPLASVEVAPAHDLVAEAAVADAMEPIDVIEPVEEGLDTLAEPPDAAPAADDRVLLQFSATVPHDLAELRRIAADNQW